MSIWHEGFHFKALPLSSTIIENLTTGTVCSVQPAHFRKTLHHLPLGCVGDVRLADLMVGSASPFLPAVSLC